MDAIELFRRTTAEWLARVRGVGRDQWKEPTPCSEWDVRTLVNHVVSEQKWIPPLMDGATIAEVGDRFDGDLLDDDPYGVAELAAAEAMGAVPDAVTQGRITHLSFGDTPADEYARSVAADLLIHAWDLAAAVAGDRRFDPETVQAVAEWFAGAEEAYRAGGAIGPRAKVTSDDPQDQLLAAFGRDPDWSQGRH